VLVDTFPDRVFDGSVLRMANEAEFTPTNVQMKEDRARLVYAVVIRVDNPDLPLKPGMITICLGIRQARANVKRSMGRTK
jgi:hypothetical protein